MQTTYPRDALELPPLAPDEDDDPTLADAPKTGHWIPPVCVAPIRTVHLTPRMADVLVGAMKGQTNKQIGARLFLTEDTVKTHMRRLFAKLEARDRTHAVALFLTREVEIYIDGHHPGPRPVSTRFIPPTEHDPL